MLCYVNITEIHYEQSPSRELQKHTQQMKWTHICWMKWHILWTKVTHQKHKLRSTRYLHYHCYCSILLL